MNARVFRSEPCYRGPLSQCLARFPVNQHAGQTYRWHREQMRAWAHHWRDADWQAAMVGRTKEQMQMTALSLAKSYRDSSVRYKEAA